MFWSGFGLRPSLCSLPPLPLPPLYSPKLVLNPLNVLVELRSFGREESKSTGNQQFSVVNKSCGQRLVKLQFQNREFIIFINRALSASSGI